MHLHILFLSLPLLASVIAQENNPKPEDKFCRRHQHQTCVIDNKLYIDGGLVYYGNDVQPGSSPQKNTWLIYGDVANPIEGFPKLNSSLPKGSDVPSVSGGILWPDHVNKVFYQYGGEYQGSDPPGFSTLWFYDTIYNSWNRSTSPDASQSQIQWPAFGAGTTTDEGIAYYYGGYLSERSVSGWKGDALMLNSLVSYDMNKRTWNNYTYTNTPRAEGTLMYIPAGERGMLVYLGGLETVDGTINYADLSNIHLFDIANNKWYTQTASGDIPQSRRAFCAGVVWASDHSSYNIYIYGGIGSEETALADAWVLSLPSFTWIYWEVTARATTFPGGKAWASCDVVYGSQMIVMSGYYTNESRPSCDLPRVGGQHGLMLGQEAIEIQPWLALMTNVTEYRVPDNITVVIGGGTDGDATLTAPTAGWATSDLSVYFKTGYTAISRAATRSIPITTTPTPTPSQSSASRNPSGSSKTNVGGIVGGVVGGVVFLIAITLIVLMCLWSRRKKQEQRNPTYVPVDHNVQQMPTEKHVSNSSMLQRSTLNSPQPSYTSQSSPPPPSEYQFYHKQNLRPQDQHGSYNYSPPQPSYQQIYYPPPSEPSQGPRGSTALGFELPTVQSPANAELSGIRSPAAVRG